MKIYDSTGATILDVAVDDNSYRYRAIMGDNTLTLYFSLAEHTEIPVGAWCEYQGEEYTLMRPEALKMQHSRQFDYTVTMEAAQAKAGQYMFRCLYSGEKAHLTDGRLEFSLTAKPQEHLQMFVDNLNNRDAGWSIGECVTDVEHLINYSYNNCLEALAMIAEEFDTEFEIVGKTVSLHRMEYNKSTPLALSYGQGNGLLPNVGRSNSSDKAPVEVLYVQGGSDNIDASTYGATELHLPKGGAIGYDGEHFEDETGYTEANARHYVADAQGYGLQRSDKALSTHAEAALDCSDIYPKRVGTVSSVIEVNPTNNFYDFTDTSIPATLDYSACQIEGETMTVVFQSGMLAGRELEVNYYHEAKGGKAARRFEIVPQEIDGQTMPNDTFKPAVGDTYAIYHCSLPAAYISDAATKTGAEWEMMRKAVKYMFDNEGQKFTFSGSLDGIFAKKDWVNIGGKIRLGGYIKFTDPRFQAEAVLVRITGIKDYINKPHSPEIELSNETVSAGFATSFKTLQNADVRVTETARKSEQFTKRRFRDAKETMTALSQALLDNFTHSITPVSVQTMQTIVGDESLQFRFVTGKTDPQADDNFAVSYNSDTKQLSVTGSWLQHLTLGIDTISEAHNNTEYKYWQIPAFLSSVLDDASKSYYLYAKCSKTAETGVFMLSETAIKMEGVTGYYHLLVGVLNSEYDGGRSFAPLYGYSEVLPARIVTPKIQDSEGRLIIDLANATIIAQNGATLRGKMFFADDSEGVENLTVNGQSLISGGRINSQLIVAEVLRAVKKSGDTVLGSINITPDGGMEMYDGANNQIAEYTAEERTALNLPSTAGSIMEATTDTATTKTLCTYTNNTTAAQSVEIPALDLDYYFNFLGAKAENPVNMGRTYTATVTVTVTVGGSTVATETTGAVTFAPEDCEEQPMDAHGLTRYAGQKNGSAAFTGGAYNVPTGSTIAVTMTVILSTTGSSPSATTYTFGVKFAGNNISATNLTKPLVIDGSRITSTVYGNGFMYARAANQYVGMLVTDAATQFVARNGAQGVQFGGGGVSRLHGGSWVAQPYIVAQGYSTSGGFKWWRKWSDGRIEQGGRVTTSTDPNNSVTFSQTYTNASNICVSVTGLRGSKSSDGSNYAWDITVTGFTAYVDTTNGFMWSAIGY